MMHWVQVDIADHLGEVVIVRNFLAFEGSLKQRAFGVVSLIEILCVSIQGM
jgi:hypothetical protein